MKRYSVILILFFFSVLFIHTDAPDWNYVNVKCVVKISNCSDVPDYMIVAHVTGPDISGYDVKEIRDNEPILSHTYNPALTVLALKRDYIRKAGGLDNIPFGDLLRSGQVRALPVQASFSNTVPEYKENILIYEEFTFKIAAVYEGGLVLDLQEKNMGFSDGYVMTKKYINNGDVKIYRDPVKVKSVSGSGDWLEDEYFRYRYSPLMAFDNNPETAWAEAESGPGVGERITIEFSEPVMIDRISVQPGWFQPAYYRKNNRVKQITVMMDDYQMTAEFTDSMTAQNIFLDRPRQVKRVQFVIGSVYKTEKWDDTCIAGISFYYQNREVEMDLSGCIDYSEISLFYDIPW